MTEIWQAKEGGCTEQFNDRYRRVSRTNLQNYVTEQRRTSNRHN